MKLIFGLFLVLFMSSCAEEELGDKPEGSDPRAQGVDSIQRGESLFFSCEEESTGIEIELDARWSDQAFNWFVTYIEISERDVVLLTLRNVVGRRHNVWRRMVLSKGVKNLGYVKEIAPDVAELFIDERKLDCTF